MTTSRRVFPPTIRNGRIDRRRVGRLVRRLRRLAGAFAYAAPTARERVSVTKDGVVLDLSLGPRHVVAGAWFNGLGFDVPTVGVL